MDELPIPPIATSREMFSTADLEGAAEPGIENFWTIPPAREITSIPDPMLELPEGMRRRRTILEGILKGYARQERRIQSAETNLLGVDSVPESQEIHADGLLELKTYFNFRFAKRIEKIRWTFGDILTRDQDGHLNMDAKLAMVPHDRVSKCQGFFNKWLKHLIQIEKSIVGSKSIDNPTAFQARMISETVQTSFGLLQPLYVEMDMNLETLYEDLLTTHMERIYFVKYGKSIENRRYFVKQGHLVMREWGQREARWVTKKRRELVEPFLNFQDEEYEKSQREIDRQEEERWREWGESADPTLHAQYERPAWDMHGLEKARVWREPHPHYYYCYGYKDKVLENPKVPTYRLAHDISVEEMNRRELVGFTKWLDEYYAESTQAGDFDSVYGTLVSQKYMSFRQKIECWRESVIPNDEIDNFGEGWESSHFTDASSTTISNAPQCSQ